MERDREQADRHRSLLSEKVDLLRDELRVGLEKVGTDIRHRTQATEQKLVVVQEEINNKLNEVERSRFKLWLTVAGAAIFILLGIAGFFITKIPMSVTIVQPVTESREP